MFGCWAIKLQDSLRLRNAKDGEVDQAPSTPLFMCCMKYLRANIEFFIGVTMRNEGHDCSEML